MIMWSHGTVRPWTCQSSCLGPAHQSIIPAKPRPLHSRGEQMIHNQAVCLSHHFQIYPLRFLRAPEGMHDPEKKFGWDQLPLNCVNYLLTTSEHILYRPKYFVPALTYKPVVHSIYLYEGISVICFTLTHYKQKTCVNTNNSLRVFWHSRSKELKYTNCYDQLTSRHKNTE